jgi:putative flippase GtrA
MERQMRRRDKVRLYAKSFFTIVAGLVGLYCMYQGLVDFPELNLHWIAFGAGWTLGIVYMYLTSKYWGGHY